MHSISIPEFFVGAEKGHTRHFHAKESDELVEANLENLIFQRKLLNAISLVIMINETNKASAERSISEGTELLDLIQSE